MGGFGALYREPVPFRPARAEVQLEPDALILVMPDGRLRRHELDGVEVTACDGFVRAGARRRFVRMLILAGPHERHVVITPPEEGAVAPNVVSVPEAPSDAAIVDPLAWQSLADWLEGGGRLAACSISELARLACIATPQFAVVIGEVAAVRAIELTWGAGGPLRGGWDLDAALQPIVDAARTNARAAEALVSALSRAAGAVRRRRRH